MSVTTYLSNARGSKNAFFGQGQALLDELNPEYVSGLIRETQEMIGQCAKLAHCNTNLADGLKALEHLLVELSTVSAKDACESSGSMLNTRQRLFFTKNNSEKEHDEALIAAKMESFI